MKTKIICSLTILTITLSIMGYRTASERNQYKTLYDLCADQRIKLAKQIIALQDELLKIKRKEIPVKYWPAEGN